MPLYLCTIFFKHFCFSFLFGAVEKVCCILIIYHNNLVVGLPPTNAHNTRLITKTIESRNRYKIDSFLFPVLLVCVN